MSGKNDENLTAVDVVRCVYLARLAERRGNLDSAWRWQAKADAWERNSEVDVRGRGSREFVGFAWAAAEGTFSVAFQERAQGMVFATHQVRDLKQTANDWRGVANGDPWTGLTREGLVLSIDPEIEAQFLGPPDDTGSAGDPFDIVVYGEKVRTGALQRATNIIYDRIELMHKVKIIPSPGHTLFGPTVTIHLKDGRSVTRAGTGREFIWDFDGLCARIGGIADDLPIPAEQYRELMAACGTLDELPRADQLVALTMKVRK